MNLNNVVAVRNIKTVYRDGDKAIKVFNEDYSKADVLNEALNQARVEETGLDIPRILEVTKLDGKWAITYCLAVLLRRQYNRRYCSASCSCPLSMNSR